MIVEITDSNFEELVLKADKPVLIDFWAVWCGPCRLIAPWVEQIAEDYEGKAIVGKMDIDTNPTVAMQYNIRSIPTLLYFKHGKVVDRIVGASSPRDIAAKLEGSLAQ